MRPKHRRALRYGLLGVVSVAVCAVAAVWLVDREVELPEEGLVPGITDELAQGVPSRAPKLRFERHPLPFRHFPGTRTHRLPEDMGSGVALEDLDGDGRPDLFFVNAAPLDAEPPPCEVYRNLGGLRFERVETPLPALLGMGVAAGDYDADGDFDLYVTGYGRNVLLRNDGRFRFTDVTDEAGVAGGGFSAGACWGDADGDGDLDLYVCRYVRFDESMPVRESRRGGHGLPATLNPATFPAETNLLYRNEGGRFREVAEEMGVSNPGGKSLGAVFADLDGDGVLDLYVANDVSDNALFRGRKGRPFEDATHAACTADWRGAMGLALGDPDRDADLDLFLTHWLPEENTLYKKEPDRLVYRDDSVRTNLGPPGRGLVGWACDFADFDNDGLPDLYVVNGSTFEERSASTALVPMYVQLFWNDGQRFFDLAREAGEALQRPIVGRGGTAGDADGDGAVDLVIVAHGAEPLLLRNVTEPRGHHLTVRVRGSVPNVFGYGATVTVVAGGAPQTQVVGAKVSYLSSGPHALHFGLGEAEYADSVTVRFLSGVEVVRRRVRAGTDLLVKEVDPRTLGARMDAARDAPPDEARAIYREILRLDPLHPGALYNLALLADPKEGLALCERLLRVEPMAPRGHLLRAKILSNPARPELLDLDAALAEIARARELNRDETGGLLEEGRILLLKGEVAAAAARFEKIVQNPRAAALAALCRFRLGEAEKARRLLERHAPKAHPGFAEEGDTTRKRMGARDPLARLLELPGRERWELERLEVEDFEAAHCEFVDLDGDGGLDVRCGPVELLLEGRRVRAVRTVEAAPRPAPRVEPYEFARAAAWALEPPEWCQKPPPGTTATCEADLDGDGDADLVAACGGDDPAAPLPWWALLREGERYRPLRGGLPRPGFRVAAVAAADLDGDGRAELLLKEGGFLPGDKGGLWLARLKE